MAHLGIVRHANGREMQRFKDQTRQQLAQDMVRTGSWAKPGTLAYPFVSAGHEIGSPVFGLIAIVRQHVEITFMFASRV